MSEEQLSMWSSIRAKSRVYAASGRMKESRLAMADMMHRLIETGATKADCADAAMTTRATVNRWLSQYNDFMSEV